MDACIWVTVQDGLFAERKTCPQRRIVLASEPSSSIRPSFEPRRTCFSRSKNALLNSYAYGKKKERTLKKASAPFYFIVPVHRPPELP